MITPETVKLADKLPELEKRLVEERAKHAKRRLDEMNRHNAELERLMNIESEVAAEHARATRAKGELMKLVPSTVFQALDKSGSDFRVAAQEIERDRRERDAAREVLAERKKSEASKEEIAALQDQLDACEDLYGRAQKKLAELKKAQARAEAAVEAEYQKIRREVLAKTKAERADRG